MLTRWQLQRFAHRGRIGLQAQERDYLQHLLVMLLFLRSQELVFKGGTALRMAYGGNRYSEDLDFNGPGDPPALEALWAQVIAELGSYGILAETRAPWRSEVGYSFDVSYRGPLYDGRDRTKGKVRVDISLRAEPVETHRELIVPEYDGLRPFVATVLSPAHLLAEKVRALVVRAKPRDLYDLWLMRTKGWRLDRALASQKLSLYGLEFSRAALEAAIERMEPDWERDLRPLLPQFVPLADARRALEDL
ncbi:MAG: nucleotidyl transferase AbiEii/AbiGii toxin family protein [Chloroflexi bacterium]|nr:nucleotidyl transferase AbiEii/AbiGii toxin family protein [Chloroflexota bacterium]